MMDASMDSPLPLNYGRSQDQNDNYVKSQYPRIRRMGNAVISRRLLRVLHTLAMTAAGELREMEQEIKQSS